jgi:ABC-type antimicrobial peptide transport system permease subunit
VETLESLSEINQIDERLIKFCTITEEAKVALTLIGPFTYDYIVIGQNRTGVYPIIGVNSSNLIQDFEMSGNFFTNETSNEYMVVGDGLSFNFFDSALVEGVIFESFSKQFLVSGVAIDSFYSGYAGYVELDVFRSMLNVNEGAINLVLLEIQAGTYDDIKGTINSTIATNLGGNFTHLVLDGIFDTNLNHVYSLSQYPAFLIIVLAVIGILSLYNYQKGGIIEKAKDILIMRSIGAKKKSLRRMINFEGLYIIIPSILLSLSIGMILNSIVLFDRVYLPPLYIPFAVVSILFVASAAFNYLSLIPIMKKINQFSIKDFDMY